MLAVGILYNYLLDRLVIDGDRRVKLARRVVWWGCSTDQPR